MQSLGSLALVNKRNNVNGQYKVIKVVKGMDPPLRKWTLYTVRNQYGQISSVDSRVRGWPDDLSTGSEVLIKKEGIYVNGKSIETTSERYFLTAILWCGIVSGVVAFSSLSFWIISDRKNVIPTIFGTRK